jgi:serine/threonine protein kinase/Tfp pilus assembly protein PilF/TolB-like protein
MEVERWQKIEDLLHAALACTPEQRAVFLARECDGDESLRREVESLISHYGKAADFLEASLPQVAAELLAGDQAPVAAGQTIGHYEVIARLGAGGMGEVYLARDTKLERKIALKILPPGFTTDPARSLRFEQEARAASALNHPNILTIHEIGQSGTIRFIATEFVDGQTLRRRMQAGTMTLSEALDVAYQTAGALAAAHEAGIVHCDIKPDNVMLRQDGLVKVLDFGLAKLLERETPADPNEPTLIDLRLASGMIIGTPHYMSPEQARGQDLDARSDIFSLGVVLFEMITGRRPFDGPTTNDVIAAILTREPPPVSRFSPQVPSELEQILARTYAKDREHRYQSSRDLLSDLRKLKQEMEFRERSKAVASGAPLKPEASASGRGRASYYGRVATVSLFALVAWLAAFGNLMPAGKGLQPVAVLPSVNLAGNPDLEYLSKGMRDGIITILQRSPDLGIRSPGQDRRSKDQLGDPLIVGRRLHARTVLSSSFVRSGDGFLVKAELLDVHDGGRLWTRSYSCKAAEIPEVQKEIAGKITDMLIPSYRRAGKGMSGPKYPKHSDAYLLCLQGRACLQSRTGDGYAKGVRCFERAIRIDPAYAPAYAGLALAYDDASCPLPPGEALAKRESTLLKALDLDDTLAEAHLGVALLRMRQWDYPSAERELRRALQLEPGSAELHSRYGAFLDALGRFDEAFVERNRAVELDPDSLDINVRLGYHYQLARQYDLAIQQFQKVLSLDPTMVRAHTRLGLAYLGKRMYAEAITELENARALDDSPERPGRFAYLAHAYAISGDREKSLEMLVQLQALAEQRPVVPTSFAIIFAGLGDRDHAFASLQKAYEDHTLDLFIKVSLLYDPLRSDPRFADLLRKVHLEE